MRGEQNEQAMDMLCAAARCAVAVDRAEEGASLEGIPSEEDSFTSPLMRRLRGRARESDLVRENEMDIPLPEKPLSDFFRVKVLSMKCFEPLQYHPRMTEVFDILGNQTDA